VQKRITEEIKKNKRFKNHYIECLNSKKLRFKICRVATVRLFKETLVTLLSLVISIILIPFLVFSKKTFRKWTK